MPKLVEDMRVLMNGPSGSAELTYAKTLEDVAQLDATLPYYVGGTKVIGMESLQPGTERQASAILVGGYNGEQRVCAFVEPQADTRLDAREGRHRLTLQVQFAGEDRWETLSIIDVDLPRGRCPRVIATQGLS